MKPPPHLQHVSACVFDAYGTLFDVTHRVLASHRRTVAPPTVHPSANLRKKRVI